ncbi:DUF368 domain-containing protein [Peptostreptococcus equinus]|uniref:DUF368 domain-containing protein n=1 Tax=Peptostreptococcus equinus TaxID=3003601 RepID=A0ABY7JSB8_9FIRM|nr:DUF368 domain-containing protein [Peptostreptococcus sp. CBA3647]WAW15741.1 DUF368 domain-containing protein [Peptostreptococcus sp. CBA3647]
MLRGFCMAMADSVPGVSGGTVAFILGFYETLLDSINNLSRRIEIRKSATFLVKLFLGWTIGMIISVKLLNQMFQTNIYQLSSLFIGLTIASVVYIIRSEIRAGSLSSSYKDEISFLAYMLVGLCIVIFLTMIRSQFIQSNVIDFTNLILSDYLYLFISGMIAISAMVLPGVSGSTLLLVFGVYLPIMSALNNIMNGNFEYLYGIVIFSIGVFFGLIFSTKIIRLAFIKYRKQMLHFIIGLTAGSVYAIMNGPTTMEIPREALSLENFSISFFLVGICLIISLELSKVYKSKKIKKNL